MSISSSETRIKQTAVRYDFPKERRGKKKEENKEKGKEKEKA